MSWAATWAAALRGRARHLVAGGVVSVALVLGAAVLSAWPDWQSLPEDGALLRLSFTHSGARNCRDRTEEELARLPPNMRGAQICERRRAPVHIEMDIDGRPVLTADLMPSGLAGSGPSRIYERIELPAGQYALAIRMRDDPAASGFTHEAAFDILLEPAQSAAIDFDSVRNTFFLH